MNLRILSRLLMFVLLSGLLWAVAARGDELVMHISKMTKPPVIDGVFREADWADACATAGFRGAIAITAYPESLGTVWYLGYDDKNIYMAMHTVFPETITLKADTKPRDQDHENSLIFDDHLEISASPYGRARAMRNGFGNYKICINPRGVFSDTWYYNGVPGSEALWSSGANIKCTTTKTSWTMTMSWPLSSMKIEKADHTEFIMHLSRAGFCSGWYFASCAPGIFMSWNEFYKMILDPDAPAVQFLRHGDIVNGTLHTVVRVGGKNGGATDVALDVADAKGQTLYQQAKHLTAPPGGASEAVFTADKLALSPPEAGHNSYSLNVRDARGRLFNCSMPVLLYTPDYVAKNVAPYLNARPKEGDYHVTVAYLPEFKLVRASLDLDVFGGLPHKLTGVQRFSVEVTPFTGGKPLAKKVFPIENLAGAGRLPVGDLPDGRYACNVRLLNAAGKELDTRIINLTRQHYPWEGNHLGEDRVVIPPFTPLQVTEQSIAACRGSFTVGKGGLFDSIKVDNREFLNAPMRVEASLGGKTQVWQANAAALEKGAGRAFPPDYTQYLWKKKCPPVKVAELPVTDGYEVKTSSQAEIGDVQLRVNGVMDYDGWYNISLTYGPKAVQANVESLDVVIPLNAFADVMFSGRDWGDQAAAARIANANGVVWSSDAVATKSVGFSGTWVPYAYLGNGGRGLWYLAESDRGWLLDDAKPCVLIERVNGLPVLRLRLVNTPSRLTASRTVNFTLFATPNQPLPVNARRMVWDGGEGDGELDLERSIWFNTGWRRYGWGGDDFYMPSDKDYQEYGDFIHYPERFEEVGKRGAGAAWTLNFLKGHKKALGEQGVLNDMPVVVYSSHNSISASLPEMTTFSGEWCGDSNLVAEINAHPGGNELGKTVDMMGRYIADTPAKVSEVSATWTRSMIDCYLWYHEKLFRLARVNGTFYDNAGLAWYLNTDAGMGYLRDDGHEQPVCSMYARRQLSKRANTMCWLLAQPPMFYPNASTFDLSFKQKMILIEGESYIWTEEGTLFDGFEPEAFRAKVLSRAPAIHMATSHEARPRDGYSGTSHRPMRSVLGMALLFDFGVSRLMDKANGDKILAQLDKEIGLFSATRQAEFVPYWDSNGLLSFAMEDNGIFHLTTPTGVFASQYRQPGKTLLWLVNSTGEGQTHSLWIDDRQLLGKPAAHLRDMETGEELMRLKPSAKDLLQKNIWAHIYLPPQTFRALILE